MIRGSAAVTHPRGERQSLGVINEFRDFALQENVVDLAVGVVIGVVFGTIVSSLVANIIMPPLNLLTSTHGVTSTDLAIEVNTPAPKLQPDGSMVMSEGRPVMEMQDDPVLNYGPFIQSAVAFLLVAAAILAVVKLINAAKARSDVMHDLMPVKVPEEIRLLREIRDSLSRK